MSLEIKSPAQVIAEKKAKALEATKKMFHVNTGSMVKERGQEEENASFDKRDKSDQPKVSHFIA